MHVWLIAAAEPIPSDNVRPMRFMSIANQLLAQGHQVTFWTTSFFHHTKQQRFASDTTYAAAPDYTVRVLHSWGYEQNISIQRFLAHRHFARRLASAMRKADKPDIILTSLPPLDTVAEVVRYGLEAQVPTVVDVIDPWPQVFLTLFPPLVRSAAKPFFALFERQARWIFRHTTAVTSISQTYLNWAERIARKPLLHKEVFYPAVDIAKFDDLVQQADPITKAAKPIRFVYAGALGQAYDVETIIGCAQMLQAEGFSDAEFLIAGNGPKFERLQAMAQGLTHVKLLGWLGAQELAALYASAHVGIACYGRSSTQTITYKLFDYLAAGLPIISSLPGEMAELIEREHVGINYISENPYELAKIVQRLCNSQKTMLFLSENARKFAKHRGDVTQVYGRMVNFLQKISLFEDLQTINARIFA